MINLNTYGWNEKLNQLKQESIHKALSHGRVTIVHRTCYEVISEKGAVFKGVQINRSVLFNHIGLVFVVD